MYMALEAALEREVNPPAENSEKRQPSVKPCYLDLARMDFVELLGKAIPNASPDERRRMLDGGKSEVFPELEAMYFWANNILVISRLFSQPVEQEIHRLSTLDEHHSPPLLIQAEDEIVQARLGKAPFNIQQLTGVD